MAKINLIFFSIFSTALCLIMGTGDVAIVESRRTQPEAKTLRQRIIHIASEEIGVQEISGRNDGARVEEYLQYTGLGPGHEWCAAFVSWCYGQAGLPQPRNPWSPALFPKSRMYKSDNWIPPADLFAVYGTKAKRINHVGIVERQEGAYILTIEGNSNNRVESRRRHVRTIYAFADWVK